jgi:hypothetical protein
MREKQRKDKALAVHVSLYPDHIDRAMDYAKKQGLKCRDKFSLSRALQVILDDWIKMNDCEIDDGK